MVNVVYIAASTYDARYTRICVASLRHFYPTIPIRLLVGGALQRGLAEELERYFDVGVADVPAGEYGWGFVKLEPLFRPPGERFLVLDSDTVITGPVLALAEGRDDDFLVDAEEQPAERARTLYYDPEQPPVEGRAVSPPAFVFNSGQWFGRSGIISREGFRGLLRWDFPRVLIRPDVFMGGDQGILNFVLNEQHRLGRLRATRIPLMRWPGHGLAGLDVASVMRDAAPPVVIHWAGMKKPRMGAMVGADLLAHFERLYYARVPLGRARRGIDFVRHAATLGLAPLWSRLKRGAR